MDFYVFPINLFQNFKKTFNLCLIFFAKWTRFFGVRHKEWGIKKAQNTTFLIKKKPF